MQRSISLNEEEIKLALKSWAGAAKLLGDGGSLNVQLNYDPGDDDPRGGSGPTFSADITQQVKP
jgi:hypothetical protein